MWVITQNKNWEYLEEKFDWIRRMQTVPQDAYYHAEGNVAVHTQMVLAELIKQPAFLTLNQQDQEVLWAAALLHDVEKYSTTLSEPDGSITSHGHARKGAMTARQILYRDIPAPFAVREQITALVLCHGLPLWIFEKQDPLKQLVMASLDVNTQHLALLAKADVLGRICADKNELLYRVDCFEEFCRENNCWGVPYNFATAAAKIHYLQQDEGDITYVPFEIPAITVVLMSGLPGAGKDSFIKKHHKNVPVISLDGLREKMNVAPDDKNSNGQVIQAAKEEARVLLRAGKGFVWNATNTTRQMRAQLVELFTTYKAAVKMVYVEAPYQRLFQQNRNREEVVPAAVLEKLISKLEVPALWEAHEVEYCVTG